MDAEWEMMRDVTPPRYNRVRDFSEQQHKVDAAVIQSVGTIFVKHQAHRLFGLTLLHRHGTLDPGTAMVHTLTAQHEDLCIAEFQGARTLYPLSFFVDAQDQFIPLEFSAAPVPTPEPQFLSELRSYFTAHGLTELLGITHILPSEKIWIEHELPDRRGTIATEANPRESNGVTTVWQFSDDGAGLRMKDFKKCAATESGAHKVT